MATKAEGQWAGVVLGATCGEDDKRQLVVRVNVRIEEGPDKGRRCTYEDTVNAKSSIYIMRSLRAVGWSGRLPMTASVTPDIDAWIAKTGGSTTVEIKHLPINKGKKYDKWIDDHAKWIAEGRRGEEPKKPVWDKVQSLRGGPPPLAAPSAETSKDADDYMRQALADDGVQVPDDDVPHAANDDSLPF